MKKLLISASVAALLALSASAFADTTATDAEVLPLAAAEGLVDTDISLLLACGDEDQDAHSHDILDGDMPLVDLLACGCGCVHHNEADEEAISTNRQLALNNTTSQEEVIVLPEGVNLA